jgi:molybdate transport system ATP-binding protein
MVETKSRAAAIEFRYLLERASFTLDVDARLPMRGITGVFGPSGSGKTSLLRCIAGLARARSAYLAVDQDVWDDSTSRLRRAAHRRAIGYVFQEPRLFSHLTVQGNLNYSKKRAAKPTLDHPAVNEEQVIDVLGLETLLARRIGNLSGGEAQRVAIGRALLRAPRFMLMDEPLSSLDDQRKVELLPFIARLNAELGVPVIFVSHNIDEICRLCDQLLVLQSGQAVAFGDLQAVLMRTDLDALGGDEAGTVISARVKSYDEKYDLSKLDFSGGTLHVPGRYAANSIVRVRVRANDVSVCRELSEQTSIQNRLLAELIEIRPDSRSSVLLHLEAGQSSFLSRITRRSADELKLHPGATVIAQLKSVSVRSGNAG